MLRFIARSSFVALVAPLLALVVLVAHAAPTQAALLRAGNGPTPGKYIYDTTGLLTSAEVQELETHAAAVRQAGAAVIVYLQAQAATQDQTQQDAANLMNSWDVETARGMKDGVVIFFNLEPGNLRHGQVALYAGQRLLNGRLPQDELQRIYAEVMLPPLETGDAAGGIAAGLDAIASDLRYGPPPPPAPAPPSAAQQVAAWIGRVPFNLLALLFTAWVALLAWRAPRRPQVQAPAELRADPPGDLPPALAGALVAGRLREVQLEATVLDLAHRGALTIEPVGADKVRVKLLNKPANLMIYEEDVWHRLEELASPHHNVPADRLPSIQSSWSVVELALRRELVRRGWWDPRPGRRRRPLYLAGWLGMLAIVAGIVVAAVAAEGWAVIGMLVFLAAGICAFVWGYRIPETTAQGEQAALPWREYRVSLDAGLPLNATDDQLDAALPYAVAMGVAGAISSRHVAATARGYSPSWFRRQAAEGAGVPHFYPYWVAFHSCMYPAPSGGGSGYSGGYHGGFAGGGGGAAAGGGGAGGGF